MNTFDATRTAHAYLNAWNATDPVQREQALARDWSTDARYVDPLMRGDSAADIHALIGALQAKFPGYRFQLLGTPDGHGEHVRLRWALGPDGQDAPIEGSDYIRLKDGRIHEVIGFLDRVPA